MKRLKAVEITPDGNLVVLSGRNGQGKTSVLDAITYALGGKGAVCAEPIRRGQETAEIVCDLGDLVVKRRFTAGGGTTLEVTSRDGLRFPSPQAMLDKLVGELTFDPLAFSREKPARQAEILRELVGLDLAPLDARRAELYTERTAVNKRATSLRARFEAMPRHELAPADPVDVGDLADQLKAAQAANQENAAQRRNLERIRSASLETRKEVDRLREELEDAEDRLRRLDEQQKQAETSVAGLQDVDTAALLEQIRGAEAINRQVRENHERRAVAAEHAVADRQSGDLTAQIEAVDQQKAEAIAAARMPVQGLGFDAAGVVTLNGLPLDQASAAEQLRVSVAIGLAMNPKLRVLLIRDASLLDKDSLAMVSEMAKKANAQVWCEMVSDGDGVGIVIEDGMVKEATGAQA